MTALPRFAEPWRAVASEIAPIASLPMYDWPELQGANDALWSAIGRRLAARGLGSVPARLTRGAPLEEVWTSPTLLLSQTCGYPLITRLAGRVRLVATPRYVAPGCEGPFRRSAIVVAAGSPAAQLADLRGGRCAVNEAGSDSGVNLLRAAVAPLAQHGAFFSEVRLTGSHVASAEAIAAGEADVAALDAVSYAHLRRLRPQLARALRVLDWSARTPGLPLITAGGIDTVTLGALREVLAEAAADPQLAEVREALLLEGFSPLPLNYYQLTLHLEERARALGYAELR
jgi:ABC-type phosphate/phosphonate transport system substrate-binding protein